MGTILQGLALAEQGHREEGIAQAHRGLATLRVARAELPRPFCLTLLAETCERIGQVEEGLEVLEEVRSIVDKTEAHVHEAELYQLYGELSLRLGERASGRTGEKGSAAPSPPRLVAPSSPEECFLKAIDITQKQQAKSWELRAATSLARLWQQQGKHHEAHKMLSEIYDWFTEGFETKDLQEARGLIDELKY